MTPRDYQLAGIKYGAQILSTPGGCALLASPTGTGKSIVEIECQQLVLSNTGKMPYIVTPRIEIAAGMLSKQNINYDDNTLQRIAREHRIWTPISFRNALLRGEISEVPGIIFDEIHHGTSVSWRDIWLAAGMPPRIGLTATPFRGTPRGTQELIAEYGEAQWLITIPEAAQRGDIAIPKFATLPFVDDDLIELNSTGEFEVSQVESATNDRLLDIAQWAATNFYTTVQETCADGKLKQQSWDRVTLFWAPTIAIATRLADALCKLGAPAVPLLGTTPRAQRQQLFRAMQERLIAIVHVGVVSEGVDLPIRRLIDLSPCMSPVLWLQNVGRATRPVLSDEAPPEYYATNRNLLRHSYLYEGVIPSSAIKEAVDAFGGIMGKSAGIRAIGLEALGRFKATEIKTASGIPVSFYTLVDTNGRNQEFACIVHPLLLDPVWAERTHGSENGERQYGKWQACTAPQELRGFASVQKMTITDKMKAWWHAPYGAARYGLDASAKVTKKEFQILPVLRDLGLEFPR